MNVFREKIVSVLLNVAYFSQKTISEAFLAIAEDS